MSQTRKKRAEAGFQLLSEHALAQNPAEQRFEWLLIQRGFRFWGEDELEQVITVLGKKPDYYVRAAGCSFLAEVESFNKPGPFGMPLGQAMAMNPLPPAKRLRTPVRHAAQQLRPYEALKIPLLVVLDNGRKVGIPTNIGDLWDALFRPEGRGQALLNEGNKCHLSAVAWIVSTNADMLPVTETQVMNVRLIHNPHAVIEFPINIFTDEEDQSFKVGPNGRLVEM
jgi:hypothetical protein